MSTTRFSPLLAAAVAFGTGILLGSTTVASVPVWLALLALTVCGALVLYLRRGPGAFLLVLLAFVAAGGTAGGGFSLAEPRADGISRLVRGRATVTIQARLLGPPEPVERGVRLDLGVFAASRSGQDRWVAASGRVRVYVSGRPLLLRGDLLMVKATFKRPTRYGNPGETSARARLARRGVLLVGSARPEAVVRLGGETGWSLSAAVDGWRRRAAGVFDAALPARRSGLLKALVLGDRSGISREDRERFARLGVSHLLAISGLHLAIVASGVFFSLCWLLRLWTWLTVRTDVRKPAAVVAILVTAGYTMLSGAPPSAQRAMVMVGIYLLAVVLDRETDLASSLGLAGLVVMALDPPVVFELSFQLSFAAVGALAVGVPLIVREGGEEEPDDGREERPGGWRGRLLGVARWAGLLAVASLVATLATAPLLARRTDILSLIGPVTNLVAVPLGGYLLVGTGLLGAFVSPLSPWLASQIAAIAGGLARAFLGAMELFSRLSWASVSVPRPTGIEMIGSFAAVAGLFLLRKYRRAGVATLLAGTTLLLASWSVGRFAPTFSKELIVRFVSVGQGDCTLVTFPGGKTMLVDSGGRPFGDQNVGETVLYPFLRHLRPTRLDWVVLTHAHPDHFGGLAHVIERFEVGKLWHNMQRTGHPAWSKLEEAASRHRLQLSPPPLGKPLQVGPVKVEVLHPRPRPNEGRHHYWALHHNDNSVVLRLTYGRRRILLTGDIERRAEEILKERGVDVRADVMKAPHHGSGTSSTPALLDRVRPTHAVFQVGESNRWGFPYRSTVRRYRERGVRIWRTDRHGMVTVRTDGARLSVTSHLPREEDGRSIRGSRR